MDSILEVIYSAIARENQLRPVPISLSDGPKTALYGRDGQLDSMALVSMIIDIEELIATKLGVNVTLVSDVAMSARSSPFATVQSLANYIHSLTSGAQQ